MKRSMRKFDWFVAHSVGCALLLTAAIGVAETSSLAASAMGGTLCDAQANLLANQGNCPAKGTAQCNNKYDICNQSTGNGTTICQGQGGAESCSSGTCANHNNDSLDQNDAAGMPCVPQQL